MSNSRHSDFSLSRLFCVLILLFLSLFSLCACSENTAENFAEDTFCISGIVLSENQPLADVAVLLNGTVKTYSNFEGKFYLSGITASSQISFFKTDFVISPKSITVTENKHDCVVYALPTHAYDEAPSETESSLKDETADFALEQNSDDVIDNDVTDNAVDLQTDRQDDKQSADSDISCYSDDSDAAVLGDETHDYADSTEEQDGKDDLSSPTDTLPSAPYDLFYSGGILYWSSLSGVCTTVVFEIYLNDIFIGTTSELHFALESYLDANVVTVASICAVFGEERSEFVSIAVVL